MVVEGGVGGGLLLELVVVLVGFWDAGCYFCKGYTDGLW